MFPPRITAIPDSTFAFNTYLVSVTIPNGIVSIGHYAFQNCLNLMDITIPDSITTIGSRAFQGNCLTNVTLGTNVRDIGIYAFFGNPIENVTIPATVENLSGSRAFGECDLSSVLILGNVDGLTGIFDYCCNLKKIILLGDITHKYNEELGVVYDEGIEYLYFDEVSEDLVVYVTPACTCQLLGDNPVKVVSQTTANVIGKNESKFYDWLMRFVPSASNGAENDIFESADCLSANGRRRLSECYVLGIDPEDPDDDFMITYFEMKDGKPKITLSHTTDGSGESFLPRVKTLGKADIADTAEEWREVPEGGDATMRFFKVEVALP